MTETWLPLIGLQAMLGMKKLDIATLERAAQG
jgi:hypothetical protein